ncbi:MAG: flavin reductase [Myxococcales bacterium]|nr:flavin reductase [Myxococcales bacterium]
MTTAVDFKDALASWASGVSVVATRAGGLAYGLTVSSFTSLSLDPPLVLVCVASRNRLPAMIRDVGRFAISLLSADQGAASSHFARAGREPSPSFGVAEERTAAGLPVVAGAAAHLACDLHDQLVVGDHTIIVGRVTEAIARPDREPLLYHRRRYRTLGAAV